MGRGRREGEKGRARGRFKERGKRRGRKIGRGRERRRGEVSEGESTLSLYENLHLLIFFVIKSR